MTTAQVVEMSVIVNNKSPIQDYVHPDDQTQPFEMALFIDLYSWLNSYRKFGGFFVIISKTLLKACSVIIRKTFLELEPITKKDR